MVVNYIRSEQDRIEAVRDYMFSGKTQQEVADQYNISKRNFQNWYRKYKHLAELEEGFLPDGHDVKGVSVLYGDDGKKKLQWVKTSKTHENMKANLLAILEDAKEDLPRIKTIKPPRNHLQEMASVIPIGDAHIGMLAWHEETGDDFDLEIAKKNLCSAFKYLIDQGPSCEKCIIINVGDYFHYNTMEPKTERSGHILDADSRAQKMIKVGVATLRFCIEYAATKHNHVHVINSSGNHDGLLAHTLNIMMANIYENNKRINILDDPTSRHYIRHGKVLIGATHGHQTKDASLPGIMAMEQSERWGKTKYRIWFRGHHHQDSRVEYNGVIVEQVRTLAAKDAYAYQHGYLSGQDLKQILYHSEYGEQGRTVCGIDLLKSLK